MQRCRRSSIAILLGLLALCACAWWATQRETTQRASGRGEALHMGTLPLAGRLAGHALALPTQATRCVNCHAAGSAEGTGPDATARFGASLEAAALTELRSRRGGPPSRFDAAALCELLRSGQDPAHVIISSNMPRYAVDDTQCKDLWTYLVAR